MRHRRPCGTSSRNRRSGGGTWREADRLFSSSCAFLCVFVVCLTRPCLADHQSHGSTMPATASAQKAPRKLTYNLNLISVHHFFPTGKNSEKDAQEPGCGISDAAVLKWKCLLLSLLLRRRGSYNSSHKEHGAAGCAWRGGGGGGDKG